MSICIITVEVPVLENILSEKNEFEKYMIFRLGEELYGSPLLRVREVAVYKEPKPVPNSAFGFEGVINLRGEVVGVIDLRKLLKVSTDEAPLCMLVFDSEMGVLAAIIDKVHSVIEISKKDIESRTSGAQGNHDCFIGIGKISLGLITMIDLQKIAKLINK